MNVAFAGRPGTTDPVDFVNMHRADFGQILNVFGLLWTPQPMQQAAWMAHHVANRSEKYLTLRYDLFPERIDRIQRALTNMGLQDTPATTEGNNSFIPALNEAITILSKAYPKKDD